MTHDRAAKEGEGREAQLERVLYQALFDSGCDGDLCAHTWHEDARKLLGDKSWERPAQRAPEPRYQRLVLDWRKKANSWNVTRGDAEIEAVYRECADELERLAAAEPREGER